MRTLTFERDTTDCDTTGSRVTDELLNIEKGLSSEGDGKTALLKGFQFLVRKVAVVVHVADAKYPG